MAPMTCLRCYSTAEPRRVKRGHHAVTVVLGLLGVGVLVLFFGNLEKLAGRGARLGLGEILVLLLVALLPNIAYQAWRLRNRYPVCVRCGHAELVPPDSPRGQQIQASGGGPPPRA